MSNKAQSSFFGFNTEMPPLSEKELAALQSTSLSDNEEEALYIDTEAEEKASLVEDDEIVHFVPPIASRTERGFPDSVPTSFPPIVPTSQSKGSPSSYPSFSQQNVYSYSNQMPPHMMRPPMQFPMAHPMMNPGFYPPAYMPPPPLGLPFQQAYPPMPSMPMKPLSIDQLEESFGRISFPPSTTSEILPQTVEEPIENATKPVPSFVPSSASISPVVSSQRAYEKDIEKSEETVSDHFVQKKVASTPSLHDIMLEQKKEREEQRQSKKFNTKENTKSHNVASDIDVGNRDHSRPKPFTSHTYSRPRYQHFSQNNDNSSYTSQATKRPPGSIMTIGDKDLVKRILMAQVSTDDPYLDDFYFHSFRSKRENTPSLLPNPNASRKAVKETELVFENTLGKIPLPSVRNPRRVLQFDEEDLYDTSKSPLFSRYHMTVLKAIETVYACVMEMDDIEKQMLVSSHELHGALLARQSELVACIYSQLFMNVGPEEVASSQNRDKFLLRILQQSKGKKMFKRALPLLSASQCADIVVWIYAHMSELDVCKHARNKDVDLFMETVVAIVVRFLTYSSSLPYLTNLLRVFIDHAKGMNRGRLLVSQVAVSLLAAVLHRAYVELSAEKQMMYPVEVKAHWAVTFNEFFSAHQGQFNHLFSHPEMPLVWDFLSQLAHFATYDHKVVLVTELRDGLLQAAVQFKKDPQEGPSVNSFLNALGLDADQLVG